MPQTSESVRRHSETLCCRRVSDGIWMYLMVSGCFWMFLAFSIFSYLFMHVLALSHSFTMFQGGLCRSPMPGLCSSVTCSVVLSPRNAEKAQQLRDDFPEVVRVANSSMTRRLKLRTKQHSAKQSYAVMPKVISMDHLTKQFALTCSIIFSHGPLFFFGASGNLNYI